MDACYAVRVRARVRVRVCCRRIVRCYRKVMVPLYTALLSMYNIL